MKPQATDVRIFDVRIAADKVLVDIYGGKENALGSIEFTYPKVDERTNAYLLLQEWKEADESLDFYDQGGHPRLVRRSRPLQSPDWGLSASWKDIEE